MNTAYETSRFLETAFTAQGFCPEVFSEISLFALFKTKTAKERENLHKQKYNLVKNFNLPTEGFSSNFV